MTHTRQDPADLASPSTRRVGARPLDVSLLEQLGHGVCITGSLVDEPGPVIEYVNPAYLDMFCCERDDVIGRSPRFAQGPLTARSALTRIREHLVAQRPCRVQAVNYRLDRTPFRLRWSIDPIRSDGELTGFVAVMDDVTVEDRVRRRLSALDMLLAGGRRAVDSSGAQRVQEIARALVEALDPLVEEVGEVTVETDDWQSTTATRIDATDRMGTEAIRVGDRMAVSLSIHPDGDPLLDRVAIDELCSHAEWLVELGPRS